MDFIVDHSYQLYSRKGIWCILCYIRREFLCLRVQPGCCKDFAVAPNVTGKLITFDFAQKLVIGRICNRISSVSIMRVSF